MSDPNSSPVTLPAGSYDMEALQKDLDRAAKGKAADYTENVEKAIDTASDNVAKEQDARDIPGYKFVEVANKDLGVKETIQVYDAKKADKLGLDGSDERADLTNQQAEVAADAVAVADSPKE